MPVPMLRMPFPRVPITFWLPIYSKDEYGNQVASYSESSTVTTMGSYAPKNPEEDIEEERPHGRIVRLRLYLPKTFDADITGAKVTLESGDSVIDAGEYQVIGEPVSYMRAATPGDMSWYVEVADFDG